MKKRYQIALLLSLFIHVLLSVILYRLDRKSPVLDAKPIDVTFIEPNADQNKEQDNKQMQIVDQNEKSANDDVPDDAKYLSRNNQKVKEETKAAMHGRFNNEAGQGPTMPGAQQKQVGQQQKQAKNQNNDQSKTKSQPVAPWEVRDQKTKSGLPTLEALKPKFDWSKMAGSPGASENSRNPSATDDYIKDTKNGAQTLLNTREFIYFTYYNRIKNQLQQYWEPKIKDKVAKLFRQGRQIASEHDRITRVRITLDSKGVLIGVAVLSNSGVEDLDEAAVEAFRAAAPFPNPPKGIIEADGTIKIDWSFILEANVGLHGDWQTARAN